MIVLVGVIGMILCVLAYALLSMQKMTSDSTLFYVMNIVGAVLLLVSIAYDFDWGDFGSMLMEICWIMISVYGLVKLKLLSKKE